MPFSRLVSMAGLLALVALVLGAAWPSLPPQSVAHAAGLNVAYVYTTDTVARDGFKAMLQLRGFTVSTVLQSNTAFDFSTVDSIILGDDTSWAAGAASPPNFNNISSFGRYIVGVGNGGAAFFGLRTLAIGNTQLNNDKQAQALNPGDAVWLTPKAISLPADGKLTFYNRIVALREVPDLRLPNTVTRIAQRLDLQGATAYPLIGQTSSGQLGAQCNVLWGFRALPRYLSPAGANVFENVLRNNVCTDVSATQADLSIGKTAAPEPVNVGAQLTYSLTVANAGPNAAPGATVVDTLPAGVTFVSATPSQGSCSFAAGIVTCSLGTLSIGATAATISIVVKPAEEGKLLNSASVAAQALDPDMANNVASAGSTVNLPPTYTFINLAAYKAFDPGLIVTQIKPDLSIFGAEITQGIQCFDTSKGLSGCADNSLPYVAKKDTTARIYLGVGAPFTRLNNIPVRLHIFANGVEYLVSMIGNATTSLDQSVHDAAEAYFNVNFSNAISVSFYAEVDPNNTISESNESNNRFPASGLLTRTFSPRKSLKLVGRRLRYHPPGYSGQQYAGGWAVNGGAAAWYSQLLPMRNNGINYAVSSGYLNWTGSLDSGTGQHALIQNLNSTWILENVFSWMFNANGFTGANQVYGWVPDQGYSGGHADMPIYPHAGGLGVVGIGTDRSGTDTDNPGGGALIMGHELTHDYNLLHTNTGDSCGSADGNANFPYSSSSIQEFGFNPITGKIYNPANTHDLMSYCPAGGSKQGWISPFTWTTMFNKLAPGAAAQPNRAAIDAIPSSVLSIDAMIDNPAISDTGAFGELYQADASVPATVLPTGDYAVQLKDAGGTIVQTTNFAVDFKSEYHSFHPLLRGLNSVGDPSDSTTAELSFVVPWVDGTTTIVLLHGAKVLDTQVVSPNAPSLQITSPSGATTWAAGSTQLLAWSASDPDNDTLHYSVFYSHDGANWALLAENLATTSYDVDVDSLAGGTNVHFRVVATDGVNTTTDETDGAINLPNKLPQPTISNPISGAAVPVGDLVVLQGFGFDLEDGQLADSVLSWSSSRQGLLGTGASLPITTLQPGLHTITLTATDSSNQTAIVSVQLFIGERVYLPQARR